MKNIKAKTPVLSATVEMEHCQYFTFPVKGPYGVGSSANQAIEDLELQINEAGWDCELERYEGSDDDELIAFELKLDRQSGDYWLDATTIDVGRIKREPIIEHDDDDNLEALIVCASDVDLLNISDEIKDAIKFDLMNSEFYFYAYINESLSDLIKRL